ncbi:MAG: AmmeMemoRadiSam system protein B, partial [Gammaproteobacteria bacterium]|nr:AmmeMemoRadiSam system protein B [Gammaproteobacteria bacterium]
KSDVAAMLEEAQLLELAASSIKALVVPHAGYIYSGPVAATAYKLLLPRREQISRVVLLGPSHRVPFYGMAIPTAEQFRTPLGDILLDQEALKRIEGLPGVARRDDAHAWEHSLEVQLPFLQSVLQDFTLIPIVVGGADANEVAKVLETLWGGEDTLIVISSDLSHFKTYGDARITDRATTQLIEQKQDTLVGEQACGCYPLNGLLRLASEKGLQVRTLDLRNSGDTAGPKNQVVGYGSYAVLQ